MSAKAKAKKRVEAESLLSEPIEMGAKPNPQAKKFFYDWMDRTRPWADPRYSHNMYALMELIVNQAARLFTTEHIPTVEQVEGLEESLRKITSTLDDHPEDYEGPCECAECMTGD